MLRFSCLIGAAILGWLVAPASADTIANFTLDNVTADEGFDVITGGFTLDFTTSTLSNINITTTEDIIVKLTTINDADSAFPTEWGGNFFEFAANDTSSSDFTDGDLLMIDLATVLTPSDVLGPTSIPIASGSFENINHCTVIGCGAVMFMPLTGSLDTAGISATPLPAAMPLFATGLGAMGLFGWRRKRKAHGLQLSTP